MKETRRLDILAAIGGVLGLVCLLIVGSFLYQTQRLMRSCEEMSAVPGALSADVRQPDLKAETDAVIAANPLGYRPDIRKLRIAVRRYPNSPRLSFRLGACARTPEGTQALKHAAELAPDNSVPLYVLASRAESRKEAVALLYQANGRLSFDPYTLPYELAQGDSVMELELRSIGYDMESPVYTSIKKLANVACSRAKELHAAHKDGEASYVLEDVRKMGQRLMYREDAEITDVLLGSHILRDCSLVGMKIAKGDKSRIMHFESEIKKSVCIRAGCRSFLDEQAQAMMSKTWKFFEISFSLYGLLHVSLGALIGGVMAYWGMRKSKRVPSSDLHMRTTAMVLPGERLFRIYALALFGCGVSTLVLASIRETIKPLSLIVMLIAVFIPMFVPMLVSIQARRQYRDTYNHLAEQEGKEMLPKKKKSPQDRREIERRMSGLDGGFAITLAIWALVVSIGLKHYFHAYPWQPNKAMGGMPQAEMKYVKDLVDGKIKVPQKYIDEVKREDARREAKRPGGSK